MRRVLTCETKGQCCGRDWPDYIPSAAGSWPGLVGQLGVIEQHQDGRRLSTSAGSPDESRLPDLRRSILCQRTSCHHSSRGGGVQSSWAHQTSTVSSHCPCCVTTLLLSLAWRNPAHFVLPGRNRLRHKGPRLQTSLLSAEAKFGHRGLAGLATGRDNAMITAHPFDLSGGKIQASIKKIPSAAA